MLAGIETAASPSYSGQLARLRVELHQNAPHVPSPMFYTQRRNGMYTHSMEPAGAERRECRETQSSRDVGRHPARPAAATRPARVPGACGRGYT